MAELPFDDGQEIKPSERKIKAAMAWLQVELMAGPRPAKEIERLAEARGIPKPTLTVARRRAGIKSERIQNHWVWSPPEVPVKGKK